MFFEISFVFDFLTSLFVAIHNNCDEYILDCCVEEKHEEDEEDLANEAFRGDCAEGFINNISIREGEENNDGIVQTLELIILPEETLGKETKGNEHW